MMDERGNHPHVIDGLRQGNAGRRVEACPLFPAILLDIADQRTAVQGTLGPKARSVMTGNGFDASNHFFVGSFIRGANEGRIAAIRHDCQAPLGIAAQSSDEQLPILFSHRSEVHGVPPVDKGAWYRLGSTLY